MMQKGREKRKRWREWVPKEDSQCGSSETQLGKFKKGNKTPLEKVILIS